MLESLLIAYVESLPLFATASACTSTGSDDEIRVVTVHTPFYQAAEISWCGMPGTRLVPGTRTRRSEGISRICLRECDGSIHLLHGGQEGLLPMSHFHGQGRTAIARKTPNIAHVWTSLNS